MKNEIDQVKEENQKLKIYLETLSNTAGRIQ